MSKNRTQFFLILFLLTAITIAAFSGVLDCGFVSFDDPDYVTGNDMVTSGISAETVVRAFASTSESNWHPLTWISHAIDVSLFGMNPADHHAVNLFFHLMNTLLLFIVMNRMTSAVWQSAFVALMFAVHPFHVESVAWVSERKDVLSGFFWILTMGAYGRYKQTPERPWYLAALICFVLGLLSKPMTVTLPFVLVLIDIWPLRIIQMNSTTSADTVRQLWVSVKEKIPFFVLSLISGIITYIVQQQGGSVATVDHLPLMERVENAFISYGQYILKTIVPANFAFFYPHPESGSIALLELGISVLFLCGFTALVWFRRARQPYLLTGWFWFIGTLVPVIGLIQVGLQGMADRYMYLPMIGLSIILAWGIPSIISAENIRRFALPLLLIVSMVVMVPLTRTQVSRWENSVSLYEHALDVTEKNHVAHNNLGMELANAGRHDEAINHFRAAMQIRPNDVIHHGNLARSLSALRRFDEAVEEYRWIILRVPSDPVPRTRLADILAEQGNTDEAIVLYEEAIRRNPGDYFSRCQLAELYSAKGNFELATKLCNEVLSAQPQHSRAHAILGITLGRQNRYDEAEKAFMEAIRFDRNDIKPYVDLAILYERMGKQSAALETYRTAATALPRQPEAHFNLGLAFARFGTPSEAEAPWLKAIELFPEYTEARVNLGRLYTLQTKPDNARFQFEEALRSAPNNAEAHYYYGNLLAGVGNVNKAKFHFSEAVRLAPRFEAARTALANIGVSK